MAVALLRHREKTFHFVTIFSNSDGRLHFVLGILRAMKTFHLVTIFSNSDGRLHFVLGILRAMKTFHLVTIFSNSDGRLHFVRRHLEKSFFNIFGMAVALLRHREKTFHLVTIFSNSDGRLHFVRRHQENFFLEYFWDGRHFAPASRGYENKTATHRALRALVFLIHSLRARNKFRLS